MFLIVTMSSLEQFTKWVFWIKNWDLCLNSRWFAFVWYQYWLYYLRADKGQNNDLEIILRAQSCSILTHKKANKMWPEDINYSLIRPLPNAAHSCAEPNWLVKYERRAVFESVWSGRFGLERQTPNSVGSVALCHVGAAAESTEPNA